MKTKKFKIFMVIAVGLLITSNLFSRESNLFSKVRANDINGVKELIAKLLIGQGADINEKNTNEYMTGETPLFIAAGEDNEELVRFLIKNGANVNAKSKKGKIPLSIATEAGNAKIIELLKANGAK
jgi:ankyrin repeat protein